MKSKREFLSGVLGLVAASVGCVSMGSSSTQGTVASTQATLIAYDEAMQQPVSLGDVTKGCPEKQLSDAQIVAEMDRHLDEMYRKCVVREYKRGRTLDTVTIDIAILGDGTVQGATVAPGSKKFRSCILSVVEDVKFPKFEAPRMGARYQFQTG